MGFFGFLHNTTSVINIYNDYVNGNDSVDKFFAFQFSQDNLETYFSLIRSSLGGLNSNPNEQQFMAAYRKLLLCMPHMSSRHTNCVYFEVSDILTVSSRPTPKWSSRTEISTIKAVELETDYQTLINNQYDPYEQHLHAYIATMIEATIIRKIKSCSVSSCQSCASAFAENYKINDSFIAKKNNSGTPLTQPCLSTLNIIKVCESVCKILPNDQQIENYVVCKSIFNVLDIDDLYDSTLFNLHDNNVSENGISHKEKFVSNIVLEYLRMKSSKIGQRITDEEWAEGMKRRKAKRTKIVTGR